MKVIYVLSVILIFVVTLLIKKKEEKIDFITTFFVGIILFSCYNIVIAFLLKILSIKIELLPLSIINYIISAFFCYKIKKDKSIQKYYILKKDILIITIITIVGLVAVYINFGFPFGISYVQIDASNHYKMAIEFYENSDIKLGGSMPGAYINNGIIFKIFLDVFGTFDGYKIFIICEIIKLILSGILFYLAIKNVAKGKLSYIIATILPIIYMIGYPLNGMLCGFVYLQMAVNIVNVLLIIMINYKEIDNKTKNIILFILSFGLQFTYFILVPPIYLAIFLYELKENKKDKIKFIKNVLAIFLLPCIMIGIYYLLPKLESFNPQSSATYTTPIPRMNTGDALVAYTFVSYYSMFIFFIPFNIYYIVNKIRKKKLDAISIILIISILYIICTLLLKHMGYVAVYYCMKSYYMLWLLSLVVAGRAMIELVCENTKKIYKTLTIIAFSLYTIGVVCSILKGPVHIKVFEKEKETIKSMYNIFPLNRGIMLSETFDIIYTHEELEVLKEFFGGLDKKAKVIYFEDGLNKEWLIRLTNIPEYLTFYNLREENGIDKYLINTDEEIYVICYKNEFIKYNLNELANELDNKLNKIAEEGKLTIYTNK